jgi:hypothetical protein
MLLVTGFRRCRDGREPIGHDKTPGLRCTRPGVLPGTVTRAVGESPGMEEAEGMPPGNGQSACPSVGVCPIVGSSENERRAVSEDARRLVLMSGVSWPPRAIRMRSCLRASRWCCSPRVSICRSSSWRVRLVNAIVLLRTNPGHDPPADSDDCMALSTASSLRSDRLPDGDP